MIQGVVAHHRALVLPLFFVGLWLLVTGLLGFLSSWYRTAAVYPDIPGEPILRLRWQSAIMGGVGIRNALTLTACTPGLRIAILRLLGPFCRPFLVPWRSISVRSRPSVFGPMVELRFGDVGRLKLSANLADRLARAAGACWPEAQPLPVESHGDVVRRILLACALMSGIAAAFFTGASRLSSAPPEGRPPILITTLFPAVALGLCALITYLRDRRR